MLQNLLKTSKHLIVIKSGVGGEEEARSATLGEDYQVLMALSARSLMVGLCESSLVCIGRSRLLMDSGASPSMPWTGLRQGMIQLAGRLRLAHVTTWLIAPEQHSPPYKV